MCKHLKFHWMKDVAVKVCFFADFFMFISPKEKKKKKKNPNKLGGSGYMSLKLANIPALQLLQVLIFSHI